MQVEEIAGAAVDALAGVFGVAALPALAMAIAMYFLKILVCFIQAYIFTLLSAMFIGQIYHPAH